ncbi:hypothetical protein K474DRAFT_1610037, partial [Panus rudis PR-1116 ss-1]
MAEAAAPQPPPGRGKEDPIVYKSNGQNKDLAHELEQDNTFFDAIRAGYAHDELFVKILKDPAAHPLFSISEDGLIYTTSKAGDRVLCIPYAVVDGQRVAEIAIEAAHSILGHLGTQKTSDYIRRWFWW